MLRKGRFPSRGTKEAKRSSQDLFSGRFEPVEEILLYDKRRSGGLEGFS